MPTPIAAIARSALRACPGLLLLAAGCGGPFLSTYDSLAVGSLWTDDARLETPFARRRFRRCLRQRLRTHGSLPLHSSGPLSPRALLADTALLRTDDGGVAVACRLSTAAGAPLLDAGLRLDDGERRDPVEEAAAAWASLLGPWMRRRDGRPPPPSGGASERPAWRTRGAPGRLGIEMTLDAHFVGPGRAGRGDGAPSYDDLFGRGRGASLGLGLGVNGYADLWAAGRYALFQGRSYGDNGLSLVFADLRTWSLGAGARFRLPLSGPEPWDRLLRSRPPFPDTRGLWITARLEGALLWNQEVPARVTASPASYPVLAPGEELLYFRSGVRFGAEFCLGLTYRTGGPAGGLLGFRVEAGVSAARPLLEGAGRAAEGSAFLTFPVRIACTLSL